MLFFFCMLYSLFVWAQKDSIFMKLAHEGNLLKVHQKLTYHNISEDTLTRIKLLNFIAAYKNRNTALLRRKLEDGKTDLYYAQPSQLGQLVSLSVNQKPFTENLEAENLYVEIPALLPGKSVSLQLEYSLQLPDAQFTGYGKAKDHLLLKYFFLVPDSFDVRNRHPKSYLDLEETANVNTHYTVDVKGMATPTDSNLTETAPGIFSGVLNTDVEMYFSEPPGWSLETVVEGKKHRVVLGYPVSEEEQKFLEFYLPLHLRFIHGITGWLPAKIFISPKEKNKNSFLGNDDLSFWKFKFQLFSDAEKADMDYFSILAQEVADQLFISDKNTDHWVSNGLKTYLEIQYLQAHYGETPLLGKLPEYKILGLRPLKITYLSRLKLLERYGMPYQYIMAQNLDQKIDEKLENLSNFNEFAISKFETGTLFNFIAEKMGKEQFELFLKEYLVKNRQKPLQKEDFLDRLALKSGFSSAFFESYMQHKHRINFKLRSFEKEGDLYLVKISKNTAEAIPFKLETHNRSQKTETYWYDSNSQKGVNTYAVPAAGVEKITLNNQYAFPESNFRDNYIYTEGLQHKAKRIKLKFITDNPNPEYNEVFVMPRIAWNNYDKLLLGLKFQNRSLFERPFQYTLTPLYSSGTQSLVGAFGVSYKFLPAESFYRSLQISLGTSRFHYDYDLSFRKISLAANMNLHKDPRSQIGRSIVASYSYLDRELNERMQRLNDYSKYNLWNLGFIYSDNGIIKDQYFFGNLQFMEDFQKLSAEGYYRWEYAKGKKISFRFFGGVFLNNHTRNGTFDLGVSRVSNYAFSYNLLAQSASSGILSQQFVVAEGGFKSLIQGYANQLVLAHNIDAHAWKMFNVYADVGLYKNKNQGARFIWDSGIKLKVIPDFLEIYFPVQSSLGFEPGFKDYGSRIRYTLNFNLGAAIGYFRRGWF